MGSTEYAEYILVIQILQFPRHHQRLTVPTSRVRGARPTLFHLLGKIDLIVHMQADERGVTLSCVVIESLDK